MVQLNARHATNYSCWPKPPCMYSIHFSTKGSLILSIGTARYEAKILQSMIRQRFATHALLSWNNFEHINSILIADSTPRSRRRSGTNNHSAPCGVHEECQDHWKSRFWCICWRFTTASSLTEFRSIETLKLPLKYCTLCLGSFYG